MSRSSIVFGDVFEHNNKFYVFLVKSEEVLYVAEILNLEKSQLLERSFNAAIRKNRPIRNPLYCYVKLETEKFKDRVAHCGLPGKDIFSIKKSSIILKSKDIKAIYKEIRDDKAPVPIELKKLVKELDIRI